MTDAQWASLHLGDESYGSNKGYFLLQEQIQKIFGKEFFLLEKPTAFLFHQGRAAEDALFTALGKLGKNMIIPSNGHFDTTHANIEANGMEGRNLFSKELKEDIDAPFKGNMDLQELKVLLEQKHTHIPLVYITVTNNTGGGQPVSLENIRQAAELSHHYGIPFFLDACRFAENAWFIKQREQTFASCSIPQIVQEMFSYADGFTISFKKDGLTNMGGGLFIRGNGLFSQKYPQVGEQLMDEQILKEGHPTYGGMSGRDIMTLVEGLKTVLREDYLSYRVNQVQTFGTMMQSMGIPVVTPFGGHAVYLDVNRFFAGTSMKPEDFGGISLTALLLAGFGHRACELGYFAFGKYDPKTGKEEHPAINYVRFAVPRLRYETEDLAAAAYAVKALYDQRHKIPGVDVVFGKDLSLRHFKARFICKK